jgi:hypothetical protein
MKEYQYIVNPQTNRKCRIDTVLGKRLIKNYVNSMKGGFVDETWSTPGYAVLSDGLHVTQEQVGMQEYEDRYSFVFRVIEDPEYSFPGIPRQTSLPYMGKLDVRRGELVQNYGSDYIIVRNVDNTIPTLAELNVRDTIFICYGKVRSTAQPTRISRSFAHRIVNNIRRDFAVRADASVSEPVSVHVPAPVRAAPAARRREVPLFVEARSRPATRAELEGDFDARLGISEDVSPPAPLVEEHTTQFTRDMKKYLKIRKRYRTEVCPICLEPVLNDKLPDGYADSETESSRAYKNITILNCGHIFHTKCISHPRLTHCPVCRTDRGDRRNEKSGGGK